MLLDISKSSASQSGALCLFAPERLRGATAQSKPQIFGRNPIRVTVSVPRRASRLALRLAGVDSPSYWPASSIFAIIEGSGEQISFHSSHQPGPLERAGYDVLFFTRTSAY